MTLKHDEAPSNFAFSFCVCRYIKVLRARATIKQDAGERMAAGEAAGEAGEAEAGAGEVAKAAWGKCRYAFVRQHATRNKLLQSMEPEVGRCRLTQ